MRPQILLQTITSFTRPLLLNKSIQLLFLVPILLFFSSSWLPYLSIYFPSHLSSSTIDRSYIFLLCNGFLVFLGLLGPSPLNSTTSSEDETYYLLHKDSGFSNLEHAVIGEENEDYQVRNESAMENRDDFVNEEEDSDRSNTLECHAVQEEEVHEDQIEDKSNDFRDEAQGSSLMSTEELNRKFDDFTRKMKEEIRIGAQPQLIMV